MIKTARPILVLLVIILVQVSAQAYIPCNPAFYDCSSTAPTMEQEFEQFFPQTQNYVVRKVISSKKAKLGLGKSLEGVVLYTDPMGAGRYLRYKFDEQQGYLFSGHVDGFTSPSEYFNQQPAWNTLSEESVEESVNF